MRVGKFSNLATEKFRDGLNGKAIEIYKTIYKGCKYSRELDINKDKHFSIDATIILQDGQKMTIQEKYRDNKFLMNGRLQECPPYPDFTQEYKNAVRLQECPPYPDFTQEYKNAVGTQFENEGEYFKLFAQLYFYGWANKSNTGFKRWCIIDVPKYKDFLQSEGIKKIGTLKNNSKHGKASFYAIPIFKLKDCFLYSNFNFKF
jgi:hypothetical protein